MLDSYRYFITLYCYPPRLVMLFAGQPILVIFLRWLEIVNWRARPVPLNTATESRPMHATFKLNVLRARAHQARACTNNDLVPSKSLENLDFDQKYL